MLFEYAPIALMEQDFSAIHSRLDALRAQGVRNLAAHLDAHTEEIDSCMAGKMPSQAASLNSGTQLMRLQISVTVS